MDDKINRYYDLYFGVGQNRLSVIADDQFGEAMQRFPADFAWIVGQRTSVACIEGIKQRPRLSFPYFAQNDAIPYPAQQPISKHSSNETRPLSVSV
jgi:hypothetical protein